MRETIIPDYAPEIIERIVANFTPPLVAARMADRLMLVATIGDEIIGTAKLFAACMCDLIGRDAESVPR